MEIIIEFITIYKRIVPKANSRFSTRLSSMICNKYEQVVFICKHFRKTVNRSL